MQLSQGVNKQKNFSEVSILEEGIKNNQIQCRICLSPLTESQIMLSPCSCTGSVKYVHEECLKKWISKLVDESPTKPNQGKAHIACELCRSNIYFTLSKKTGCNNSEKIKHSIKSSPIMFFLFIFIFLVSSGFFFALLDYMINLGWTVLEQNNAFLIILMICAEVVLCSIIFTMLGLLIKFFFTHRLFVVEQIQKLEQNGKNSLQVSKKALIFPKNAGSSKNISH